MNTNLPTTEIGLADNYDTTWGYKSIDVPAVNEAQRFEFSMLKLARIFTDKEGEKLDLSAAQISRLLYKHRDLHSFSAREIKERLWDLPNEIRGGGVVVEWFETDQPHRRNDPPHFNVSFRRLYNPDESRSEIKA